MSVKVKQSLTAASVIIFGIVAWSVALVIALAMSASPEKIWVCVVGIAFGVWGLSYTIRRAKREHVKNL